jgi:hypothetical protein
MISATLLAASIALAPGDTTVLASAKASFWSKRPEVLLVREGETAHLAVTARDPQFFARNVATLYPASDTAGKGVATLTADSSSVDARSNTNRHTLRFPVTAEQLRAWAAGSAPLIEVGGLVVKLPGAGRDALKRAVPRAGAIAPR